MSTTANRDSERILQVRNLDPDLKRKLKVECIERDVAMPVLLAAMWEAYRRATCQVSTTAA